MSIQREDRIIFGAIVCCALVGAGGWWTGREATKARSPVTFICPAIPPCPAPSFQVPASQVVITRCDPLDNLLRVHPVDRRPPPVAEFKPIPLAPAPHPGEFPAPLGAE